ncbi:hypothetical protein NQK81_01125 [Amycolatopsis roodepoortensis]|uniref:hypothetical protein n=1 Tax=Amycolatopsis roodepoortensis TaxID=700274 RepID=UPI00214C04EC|nr:hypothetical protein [Amycolatopsis roodepoortensis]UUV32076.1 hypothetical protein NQK81_01125 [Amycolatopsis roodepoortensis]
MIEHFDTLSVLAQIPNPAPLEPPGAKQILGVVGNVKWAAGIALLIGFFAGLVVWAGGRWIDHHRAGKVGLVMMLCAIGGGILYGIGWQAINYFAGAK